MKLRLGTRGSRLALAQSGDVARMFEARGHEVEVQVIKTTGDRDRDRAFVEVGAPGVFVIEIEQALVAGSIDVAVHSYKDLPSKSPAELVVAAVPERVDAADRLLIRPEAHEPGQGLIPVRRDGVIGTASARRQALLRHFRPDLRAELLRGNLPTRVARVRDGDFDATLLAAAGLMRLDRTAATRDPSVALDRGGIAEVRLDPAVFVPAPSQGALAIQVRRDAAIVRAEVEALDDVAAHRAVRAERALLALVEGGCQVPFGAWARAVDGGLLEMMALLEREGSGADPIPRRWRRRCGRSCSTEANCCEPRGREDGAGDARGRGRRAVGGAPGGARRPARRLPVPGLRGARRHGARWLALTSRRGVEAVARLAPGGVPAGVAIAAVGPATAEAARALLGRCDLVAAEGTGAALAEALRDALDSGAPGATPPKVAIAAADRAERHLERALEPAGVTVARVAVYRTVPAPPETPRVALDALGVDTILLASPSAVAGLVHRAVVPGGAAVVTIGPSTTEAARAHGLLVRAEARRPGLEGILEVIP